MEKCLLGRTGFEVTRLGYGAMELRGRRVWDGKTVSDEQAERILNAVLDAGINFIDTSNDYGLSEEFIGKYISHRRDEYYLATKCGCLVVNEGDHDEVKHYWTKENILLNIQSSLERMKTDHVDLWQLHNPTVEQVQENDLLDVMEQVKSEGKVRSIGISTTLPYINTFLQWDIFDTFQIPYSGLQREHEELITAAAKAGYGTIIRGGLAQGELGISYRAEPERWDIWERAKLDELRGHDESRTAFLLRFTLSHHDIHTIIAGTLNPEHLAENVRAVASGVLPAEIYDQAKSRLDAVGEKSYG